MSGLRTVGKIIVLIFTLCPLVGAQSIYSSEFNSPETVNISRLSEWNPWLNGSVQSTIKGFLKARVRMTEQFDWGRIKIPYMLEYDTDFSNRPTIRVSPYIITYQSKPLDNMQTTFIIHGSYTSNNETFLGFELITWFDRKFFTLSIGANRIESFIFPEITGLLQISNNTGLFFDFSPTKIDKELSIGILLKAS